MTEQARPRPAKVALIFPGQGSQHAGMGQRVAEASAAAREVFARADEILRFNVTKIVMDGSERDLQKTVNTQPAILAVSWAYLVYVRERAAAMGRQLRPSHVSGHSFGQFSAAAAGDAISFEDALGLARERGRIMTTWSKRRPGGMASVIGPTHGDVADICSRVSPDGEVGVAAMNAPGQTVISGTLAALGRAIESLRERGRVVQLPISVPGHFPKMAEARDELRRFIDDIEFRDPKAPIVSSLTGKILVTAEEVRQELSEQMTGAINWMRAFREMRRAGASAFFEVGPGHVLSNITKRLDRDARIIDIFDESQWVDLMVAESDVAPTIAPAAMTTDSAVVAGHAPVGASVARSTEAQIP
ncbi:MAG: ACP S-malonyltransferase [Chloroflexota bacterium]|nr:ACP S-malonyltransferase [Chloroflexota bacterium]